MSSTTVQIKMPKSKTISPKGKPAVKSPKPAKLVPLCQLRRGEQFELLAEFMGCEPGEYRVEGLSTVKIAGRSVVEVSCKYADHLELTGDILVRRIAA